MEKTSIKLTVFFEESFYVWIFERNYIEKINASKVIFGKEPKNYEIYNFILNNFFKLKFGVAVEDKIKKEYKINPKRIQRMARKDLSQLGIGTKAQQALKAQQEQKRFERKVFNKKKSEEEKKRQFELRTKKRKEKHRGR